MEENCFLTAFELLHELLDYGHDAQTIRLKEFFSDPSRFSPDQISWYNSIRGMLIWAQPNRVRDPNPANPFKDLKDRDKQVQSLKQSSEHQRRNLNDCRAEITSLKMHIEGSRAGQYVSATEGEKQISSLPEEVEKPAMEKDGGLISESSIPVEILLKGVPILSSANFVGGFRDNSDTCRCFAEYCSICSDKSSRGTPFPDDVCN
ncbi:hypothetical protein F2Q68_00022654 [Brassica cretica]|uniref:Uncharacterized protein n=1 Tax=Brassica cretica TaxID=69181 RepID=A0A8S9G4N6_BRACR|nr:hypothetical protein F2Q68_00022654 [Brassica cretica]